MINKFLSLFKPEPSQQQMTKPIDDESVAALNQAVAGLTVQVEKLSQHNQQTTAQDTVPALDQQALDQQASEQSKADFAELKAALDDSSDKNRNLLITFLVLEVYVFSATFSVTDVQLFLIDAQQSFSLFNFAIPMEGFSMWYRPFCLLFTSICYLTYANMPKV